MCDQWVGGQSEGSSMSCCGQLEAGPSLWVCKVLFHIYAVIC